MAISGDDGQQIETSTADGYTPGSAPAYTEWRCHRCRRLLAMVAIESGTIEMRCRACSTVNVIRVVERRRAVDTQNITG